MNCKNCKTELTDTSYYCNSCGGKVIRNRLTFKNLFEHISETFFNYDNKLLRTFTSLFTKPEDVIGGYIDGVRKKYVNLISYYAIAITLSGFQIFILNKFFPEAMDLSALAVDENAVALQKKNIAFIQEYQSIIMMFYVPIYALMSKLVFFNKKKFNYTEHLVIFMYILAQISIVSIFLTVFGAFIGVSLGEIAMIIFPMQVIYSAYCLKRLYKLSVEGIILRTLLFFGILLIIMIVLLVIVVVLAIVFKDSEFMKALIEAQEAAKQAKGG
jgi:hypothetical protein